MGLILFFLSINLFAQDPILSSEYLSEHKDLFTEIPELQKRQKSCLDLIKQGTFTGDVPNCVIKGTGDGQIPPLTEEQINQLTEKLKTKVGPQFEAKELFTVERRYDSSIKKLGDYFFQKLNESLYGKADKDDPLAWSKKRLVEHSTFYEIYKNQVSKNLIETLSSYCIEADKENSFIISIKKEEREKIREKNIKNLEIIYGEGQKATSLAFQDWEECMQGIQHICYKTPYYNRKKELIFDYSQDLGQTKVDQEYSQRRACIVMSYLRGARQTILKVTEIQKLMNYVDGSTNKRIDWFKEIAGIELFSDAQIPVDSITGIVSGDIKKSEMEKEVTKNLEALKEKCTKNQNEKECQKFIFEDEEKTYKLASEIALKTEAMLNKIEKMDDAQLKIFLSEQGYSPEKIKELEKYKSELKNEIIERYQTEQQALIDQLAKKIESRTLEKALPEEQKEKIDKIIEELSSRPKEFTQLVHFNNMISGYLTVTADGKRSKNYQSIFREIAPMEDEKGAQDIEEKKRVERLKQRLAEHSISVSATKKEVQGISVEALNNAVLIYQTEKMAERPIEGWDESDTQKLESL